MKLLDFVIFFYLAINCFEMIQRRVFYISLKYYFLSDKLWTIKNNVFPLNNLKQTQKEKVFSTNFSVLTFICQNINLFC